MSTAAAGAPFVRQEEEIEMPDAEFASVRIAGFFSPRQVVFDLFVKLGSGRYLRVYRAGEPYEESELKAYETDRGIRYVHFERKHRSSYVLTSLVLLKKIAKAPNVPGAMKFGVARVLSELYLQELYECADADRRRLIERGQEIVTTLAEWVDSEPSLARFLLEQGQVDANNAAISFFTGVLSCLLSHRMPWKSRRTTETLLFSCFLADTGIYALPPELSRLTFRRMNQQQKRQYEKHPEASYILVSESGAPVSENIRLIIRQHHEYCDGSGYPAKLTADKILLLSKVVSLCGDVARSSSELLLPPADAAASIFPGLSEKLLQEQPELVAKYEKELLLPLFGLVTGKGAAPAAGKGGAAA